MTSIEVVQEIFMKIWTARVKLTEVENFGGYLNRILRNHTLNVLKKMSKEVKSNEILQQHLTEIEDSTNLQLDYDDTLKMLNDVLEKLPTQQRTVYTLCHQQGLKYDEAAVQMNISTETVHAHMRQALKKIREHFKSNSVLYPALFLFILK